VWAQYTAQAGKVPAAIQVAEKALQECEKLMKVDPEYQNRLGVTAMLLRQLYGFVGDGLSALRIERDYKIAMEAYSSSQ